MYWLLKAEPDSRLVKGQDVKYTIDDLKAEKVGTWDGVRNNEARKHMIAMKKGDLAFFYRSNCKDPGIVGTMKIVKEAYPDETAKDPNAPYYEPKNPNRWVVVDVQYESHLPSPVLLHEIKATPQLKDMQLVKRSRLSVTPVTKDEWDTIMKMSKEGLEKAGHDQDPKRDAVGTKRTKNSADKVKNEKETGKKDSAEEFPTAPSRSKRRKT